MRPKNCIQRKGSCLANEASWVTDSAGSCLANEASFVTYRAGVMFGVDRLLISQFELMVLQWYNTVSYDSVQHKTVKDLASDTSKHHPHLHFGSCSLIYGYHRTQNTKFIPLRFTARRS